MTSLPTRTRRRAGAALLAGALAAGGLTVAPAGAAIAVEAACPAHTAEDGFTDTGLDGSDVEHAVDCLVAHGISTGRTATTYEPRALVTRGQLATFALNVLEQVEGFVPPAAPAARFPDVVPTGSHATSIDRAAALGIVAGYEDGLFRAEQPVRRDQMATFVAKTLAVAGVVVPGTGEGFPDTAGNRHEASIVGLQALEVVEGQGTGRYEPGQAVRRDTMARYLTRTLEVLVRDGRIAPFPPPGPTVLDARIDDAGVVGVLDAGDVLQLVASEPLAATADDVGQRLRLVDGDGTTAEVTCGVEAACVLQGPGTYQGVATGAGQVLRVHLHGPVVALPGAEGTVPGLQLPVILTNVGEGVVDLGGRPLVLGPHSDTVLDASPLTPPASADDGHAPDIVAVDGSATAQTLTVTYSEAVVCDPDAVVQFGYTDVSDEAVRPVQIECDGTEAVRLVFDPGVLVAMDHGALTYDDADLDPDDDDIRDLTGNQALGYERVGAFVL